MEILPVIYLYNMSEKFLNEGNLDLCQLIHQYICVKCDIYIDEITDFESIMKEFDVTKPDELTLLIQEYNLKGFDIYLEQVEVYENILKEFHETKPNEIVSFPEFVSEYLFEHKHLLPDFFYKELYTKAITEIHKNENDYNIWDNPYSGIYINA